VEISQALEFAGTRQKGTLVTIRRDGRPQVSNVLYVLDGDSALLSVTADRAKTRNLARDPRACLHVTDETFWKYVVLDGTVSLMSPASDPHDATVEALVSYYRQTAGEHPDWDDYRAAMVAEQRLIATLTVADAYGQI